MKEELQYRAPDSSVILSEAKNLSSPVIPSDSVIPSEVEESASPVILSEAKNLSLSVVLCQSTELPLIYEEEEDW